MAWQGDNECRKGLLPATRSATGIGGRHSARGSDAERLRAGSVTGLGRWTRGGRCSWGRLECASLSHRLPGSCHRRKGPEASPASDLPL